MKSHIKVISFSFLIILISGAFYSLKSSQKETILKTYRGRPAPGWVKNPSDFYKKADNSKFDPGARPWESRNKKLRRFVFLSSWFPSQAGGFEGDTALEATQRACSNSQKVENLFWEAAGKYYPKQTDFRDHTKIWWKETRIRKGLWSHEQYVAFCAIVSKRKVVPQTQKHPQKHQSKGVLKNEKAA